MTWPPGRRVATVARGSIVVLELGRAGDRGRRRARQRRGHGTGRWWSCSPARARYPIHRPALTVDRALTVPPSCAQARAGGIARTDSLGVGRVDEQSLLSPGSRRGTQLPGPQPERETGAQSVACMLVHRSCRTNHSSSQFSRDPGRFRQLTLVRVPYRDVRPPSTMLQFAPLTGRPSETPYLADLVRQLATSVGFTVRGRCTRGGDPRT